MHSWLTLSNEEKFIWSIYRFTGDRNRKMSLTWSKLKNKFPFETCKYVLKVKYWKLFAYVKY